MIPDWIDPFGLNLLYQVTFSSLWIRRKVDSFRLLDEPSDERRVSLDLTVPDLVPADFLGDDRLLLPIAVVRKGPLTRFDAEIDGGRPLSIADRPVNSEAMTRAVVTAFEIGIGAPASPELRQVIRTAIESEPDADSVTQLERLRETGVWRELAVPDAIKGAGSFAWDLLFVFSENFLLSGLVAAEMSGRPTLVKYRYSWQVEAHAEGESRRAAVADWFKRILASIGWAPITVSFELGNPYIAPASYHLELHAAPDSRLEWVRLAQGGTEAIATVRGDVAHVAIRNDENGLPDRALAALGHAPKGRLRASAWSAFIAAVFFGALYLVPGLAESFTEPANRAATSLFTSVPAILFAIAARAPQNRATALLHNLVRDLNVVLALCFFATAFSIVSSGVLDLMSLVVAVSFWYSASLALTFGFGVLRCRMRGI